MTIKAIFVNIIISLVTIVPVIIAVAFFTLAERKVLASIHRREGPNVTGFWGLLQPFADAIKLILKEIIIPTKAYTFIFLLAPCLSLFLSLIVWVIIPFNFSNVIADLNLGILFWLAISSLNVYSVILAGWSSNSKYAVLGGLRSVSQMISYEISLSLCVLPVILCANSLNLTDIIYLQKNTWYIFPLLPIAVIFFISMLAETNRAPFDLPEAEAELVAGFFVEYSGITFAMFFLGEYSNMLIMCSLFTIFFLGGWWPFFGLNVFSYEFWFVLKICIMAFLYIIVRGAFPRFRYDQLMFMCWKVFLPFSFSYLLFVSSILLLTGGLVTPVYSYFI
jgi:NADH-quinone oxidoreductase subunit H